MPVRLHGLPGGRAVPPPAAASPPRFRSPITVGRVIYFVALLTGGTLLLRWLVLTAIFVTATGVVERDVDRLAARERGRITRLLVQMGEHVREGQPLAWLDYSDLRERRLDLDRQLAMLRASIAGLHAQAQGLAGEHRTLARSRDAAERLVRSGAATESEAAQLAVKLAEVDKDLAAAQRAASEQEQAAATLRAQEAELDRALAGGETNAPGGVIRASRDGMVAWVERHAGEVVGPGDLVVVLADERKIRVRAFVAPKDALAFGPKREVTIRLPTGESLRGVVEQLHLLASVATETPAPQLGRPQNPTVSAAPPPVDPNAAFLLADVTVVNPPSDVASRLVVGAPCEVRVPRAFWGRR